VSTPEGKVKSQVKDVLKKYAAYWHCPVQNGMGAPTLDFVGCHFGEFFAIETKAPGKKPTPRQELTMDEMKKAAAKVFVIDGDTSELEEWLSDFRRAVNAKINT
jgi:hypothetical protein